LAKLVHIIRRCSAPCFWILLGVVTFLALGPQPAEQPLTGWDKSNHVLAFLALACTALVAWPRRAAAVCAALVAYGAAIELLQLVVPDREGGLVDFAADVIGVAIGWAVMRMPVVRRTLQLD
jgi:VanZ family protein